MPRRQRPPDRPSSRQRLLLVLAGSALLAAAGLGAAFAFDRGSAGPHVTGALLDRRVPRLLLRAASGRTTSLEAFHGKIVLLMPFLTLCHEVCPLTTAAFETMQQAVDQAGLGGRVSFAEVRVDPWRDTPARLRAFARMSGRRFQLFTGTQAELARFWRFFGVASYRTKEGTPPDIDWLTHKPLTFDVAHTDGLFLLDARGDERILNVGMPDAGPHLSHLLLDLLNAQGRQDLAHPQPGWTTQQGLDDIGTCSAAASPAGARDAVQPPAQPRLAGYPRSAACGVLVLAGVLFALAGPRKTPRQCRSCSPRP